MPLKALLGILVFFLAILGLVAALRGQLLSGLGDIRRMLDLLR
jgi:hypothetical protein